MSLTDDLATIRRGMVRSVDDPDWKGPTEEALDRVEAEIARLEGELTEWRTSIASEKLTWRAEAAEAERDQALKDAGDYLTHLKSAEAEVARLRDGLRPFVEDYDFHAADYLANLVDGEEARVLTARTVDSLIEDQRKARALLAEEDA